MLIQETYINQTEGYQFSATEPYEPFTDDLGKLYRHLQAEYGRCTGHVYIDQPGKGKPLAIGWVFIKRMAYEDARNPGESYIREVWVSVLQSFDPQPPIRKYINVTARRKAPKP